MKRHAALVGSALVLVLGLSSCARSVTTTVTSSCTGGSTYVESVPSTVDPTAARPGQRVAFEVRAGRRQQDTGPLVSATYRYPLPEGIDHVVAVTFPTDSPSLDRQTWVVEDHVLVVQFLGAPPASPGDPSFIGNELPAVRIDASVSSEAVPGATLDWKPAARWEWRFAFRPTVSCTVADPDLVLQSTTVS